MENNYTDKILFFQSIINDIQYGANKYKSMNIMNINEYNFCLEGLEKVINLINTVSSANILNELQYINNTLSSLIKNYGIYNFEHLIQICLGNDYIQKHIISKNITCKYEIIKKYLHPINYKIISWNDKSKRNTKKVQNREKEISKNKMIDDKILTDEAQMFECFDMMRTSTNFYLRVYGVKVIIHDIENKKTLNINCIFDDLLSENIYANYFLTKRKSLTEYCLQNNINKNELYVHESWVNYFNNLNIKDYLIYSNQELVNKYIFIMSQIMSYEQKTINTIVQEFIGSDLFSQRSMLIQLLLNNHKQEFLYIAYLLYDLLSNENITSNDSNDQKMIYDSMSWNCKKFFKQAMYSTIEYTSNLSNFDNNKIPLEQQICLMKVTDNVKEKAMQKLKEIKSKSEDSGSKARQYLDGLLKIPFGIYKEENIMIKKHEIFTLFNSIKGYSKNIELSKLTNLDIKNFIEFLQNLLNKNSCNSLEILNKINEIQVNIEPIYKNIISLYIDNIVHNKKKILIHIIDSINGICKKHSTPSIKLALSTANIIVLKNSINEFVKNNVSNINILNDIISIIESINDDNIYTYLINIEKHIEKIIYKNNEIINYINSFNKVLNNAIYGHDNAKKQIERVLGQWINGDKSGYCFGFEGPPGVGKTTLAKKGLANCLLDVNDESRPFAFIALGGSSNGSTLDGHNYTYVGSTWGKIVDILIEKKCMNPIIFIDELDKVSKTEHGKEIIGILTHLIDSTQNNAFQDKYFSNIDLDLSKVLFIFSYNDVDQIDKILLDRIHRIKFDNLLLEDKLIITKDYLLPNLYTKFGIDNIINIDNELIKYIIENYTNESGVRKLKEILFEIISSINLDLLKNTGKYNIPLQVTSEIIENILYDRRSIRHLKVNTVAKIGIINGMWANAYGNSGILHIESKFYSTSTFLELKLTGMQGDVMKESMAVAKTLALSLVDDKIMKKFVKSCEETKMQGIHIHVPEGATPKDGPSAGAAITLVLYSLLTDKKIKNNYAITGEICLQGNVTAIGGLDLKILGGIRAGVTTFLYPKDNSKDFEIFYDKHREKLDKFEFYEIEHINDVIKYMLV